MSGKVKNNSNPGSFTKFLSFYACSIDYYKPKAYEYQVELWRLNKYNAAKKLASCFHGCFLSNVFESLILKNESN